MFALDSVSTAASMRDLAARMRAGTILQWCIFVIVLSTIAGPILVILLQSALALPIYATSNFITARHYSDLATNTEIWGLAWNSLALAGLTTIYAQFTGVAAALLFTRTDLPLRRVFGLIFVAPSFVSTLVIAFGWSVMYSPAGYISLYVKSLIGITPWNLYSLPAMAVVAGTCQAPLTYLICISALASVDRQLENAARVHGAGPLRALIGVTLPLLRPALISSGLLNFVGGLELLGIPLLFRDPRKFGTVMTFVYEKGFQDLNGPNYGIVCAVSFLLLVCTITILFVSRRFDPKQGRLGTLSGRTGRRAAIELGLIKWPLCILVASYLLAAIVAALVAVLCRSFVSFLTPLLSPWRMMTLDNYLLLFGNEKFVRSIQNSLIISILGGLAGTALVTAVAVVTQRSNFFFKRQLAYLAFFPRSLPGVIVGLGFFMAAVWVPLLSAAVGTLWLMTVALIVRHMPSAIGSLNVKLEQISLEIDRSGQVSGADWLRRSFDLIVPLLKPAIFSAGVIFFIHMIQDYATLIFLFAPGTETLGVTMLQLWMQGDTGPVAAAASVQLGITLLFVGMAQAFERTR